jgi:hypothetical protein
MIDTAATWSLSLLTRISPSGEPLCGDILEEYRAGRSPLWLWRQIAYAYRIVVCERTRTLSYQSAEGLALRCAVVSIFAFQGYASWRLGAFLFDLLRHNPVLP